ncbi:Hap43p-repressed protein [Candida albicans P60002]|nr:Hap43p-repressed protein [Candida albicans P60002]
MMFARIFIIILMVGGVWCERCPECAEPARILRNECGVPTKTDLGGYLDCVCGLNGTFFDMYESCLKHCKALDYITFNTNNSTLREFYCQEAQKASTTEVTDTFPDAELQRYVTRNGGTHKKPSFVLTILMCMI